MQQIDAKSDRKRKQDVLKLVSKIRRLKNKLISYGMTVKESIDSILYQFLKAPQIDWTQLNNTTNFYQIQNKYHTDHNTAELILVLNAIVPTWESRSVVQYLNQTLTYNALFFDINLQISDDSSNQDGGDMTLMLIKAKKKNKEFAIKNKKRNHHRWKTSEKFCMSSDDETKKKIHSNQKIQIQNITARKLTEDYFQDSQDNFVQTFNCYEFEKTLQKPQTSFCKQNFHQPIKMKKISSQQQDDKYKRQNPNENEHLEEEKLEKKIKK